MSTTQIKTLVHKGFHVGAHSLDHPLYNLISLEEQLHQTNESVNWVCNTFGIPYRTFAFPYVDKGVSNAFLDRLINTGGCLDLILGNRTGMLEKHPAVLHRFIGENPFITIEAMVKTILLYSSVKKSLHREYVHRK